MPVARSSLRQRSVALCCGFYMWAPPAVLLSQFFELVDRAALGLSRTLLHFASHRLNRIGCASQLGLSAP